MNYPKGIKLTKNKNISYGNRGMGLEKDLNETNVYYLAHKVANIHKKPTNITIASVDYPSRYEAVIKEAYFKTPSTTDYNGIYKGRYIDFEAKETNNKSSFPLNNLHTHQINHLKSIIEMGGIGFLIIRFKSLNETYLLDGETLINFIEQNNRKSISINFLREYGYIIKDKIRPRVDYLEIIDNLYFKGGNNNE